MTSLNLDDSQQCSRSEPSSEPSTSSLWRTFDQNIAQSTYHRTTATDSIIEVKGILKNLISKDQSIHWTSEEAMQTVSRDCTK